MAGVVKKSFGSPDERRTPDKTEVEVVDLGSVKAARMTLQPGWKWSDCIKPVARTESCQIHHEGMVAAGRMHVRHNDGTELEIGPGDAAFGLGGLDEGEDVELAFAKAAHQRLGLFANEI